MSTTGDFDDRPAADAPSVWSIVGNIRPEHPSGPGGEEVRRGTRLFRPNAKIYLLNAAQSWALDPERHPDERIVVLGQHRKSRQWIRCWLRSRYTTNWRIQLVYGPKVLERLREEFWAGFELQKGEFHWPEEERRSPAALQALCAAMDRAVSRCGEERRKRMQAALLKRRRDLTVAAPDTAPAEDASDDGTARCG